MAVVGIDLGTTNTVIAAVRDGRATALKDRSGRALLPSVVSFGIRGSAKVGYPAKDRRTLDPENTVFSIKRLIGRTFDSEHVQKSLDRYPFKLKEGPGKATMVSCHGQDHTLPEISALVLQEAATIAEQRLGERISDAVITVPANFNDLQRAATKIAGRTAGLEVLRIINEPTAAALAYGFGKSGRERIVVYDFGGGTFDVTLLDLNENVFEVLATAGDTFLGGDDVDRAIMDRMAEALLAHQKIDADQDILVREQLRVAAEKLKIELSSRSMAKARIEDLEFEFTMRRSEFESLTEPLLAKTLSVCEQALDVAGVFIRDIDQVLLVGGSTRIPLVRRRVSSFFSKMPQSRINPDEVVAIGAAIQASSLEAKQGTSQLPDAPRPRRATSQSSRAPAALGRTKTGLAGLKQTLVSKGERSEVPPAGKPGSLLSALKPNPAPSGSATADPRKPAGDAADLPAVPPARTKGAMSSTRTQARPPLQTLSGMGEEKDRLSDTLSGVQGAKSTTNLGLGQAPGSPPAQLGAPPPRAVVPAPGGTPRKRPPPPAPGHPPQAAPQPAASPLAQFTQTQVGGTADELTGDALSLDEQMNLASTKDAGSGVPKDGDGSVTFDLEELEEEDSTSFPHDDFDDDETTEVFNRQARGLQNLPPGRIGLTTSPGGTMSSDLLEAELPVPIEKAQEGQQQQPIEEVGDSAVFMLPDDEEEEEADLPAPVTKTAGFGARNPLGRTAEESDLISLQELTEDDNEEIDLPSPASGPHSPTQADDRDSDLPLPVVHAPGTDLPTYQTSHGVENQPPPEPTGTGEPKAPPAVPSPLAQTLLEGPKPVPPSSPADLPPPAPPLQDSSPEPDAQFDPFPSRALMDSVAEIDDLAAKPIDHRTSFSPPGGSSPTASATLSSAPSHSIPPAPTESVPHPVGELTGRPLLLDVTPLSLGVEVVGGYVDRLIERNSPVPCECTRTFATASDNQAVVRVRVSQGEDERFEQNTVLGEVQLSGLSPGPRGSVKIDVSFSLDESGMLQVSARDPSTGSAADARLALAGVAEG